MGQQPLPPPADQEATPHSPAPSEPDEVVDASQTDEEATPADKEPFDEPSLPLDEASETLRDYQAELPEIYGAPKAKRPVLKRIGRGLLHLLKSPWYLLRLLRWLIRKSVQGIYWLLRFKRIDRYLFGKFMTSYFFLIGIFTVIAIVFDFNEKIDKLTMSGATQKEVWIDYYLNFIPFLINMLSPMFVFIGVIFFTTNLASKSEIVAMKAAGMSFNRLLYPYLMGALFISVLTFGFGAYVIPKGNVARIKFENKYIKKRSVVDIAENVQMQVDNGVVAYISHFDNRTKSGSGFSLDKFSEKKLVSRLTAETIQYDTLSDKRYSWTLHRYMKRTMVGSREKIETGTKLDTTLIMQPSDFFYVLGQEETMTLPELKEFIDRQRMRGAANVSTFEVAYHNRFATPFAAFILTLIGVSIAIEKRKGGMGTSIGLGLALTFTYILLQRVLASFATKAGWPADIAVWTPNILFILVALGFYRKTPQ